MHAGLGFKLTRCTSVKVGTKLVEQVRKALYCLLVYRKLRNISIPLDLQLKLFDTLILPILTSQSIV